MTILRKRLEHRIRYAAFIAAVVLAALALSGPVHADDGAEQAVTWLPIAPTSKNYTSLGDCNRIYFSPNEENCFFGRDKDGYLWLSEKNGFLEIIAPHQIETGPFAPKDTPHKNRIATVINQGHPQGNSSANLWRLTNRGFLVLIPSRPRELAWLDASLKRMPSPKPHAISNDVELFDSQAIYSVDKYNKKAVTVIDPDTLETTFTAPFDSGTTHAFYAGRSGRAVAVAFDKGIQILNKAKSGNRVESVTYVRYDDVDVSRPINGTMSAKFNFVNGDQWLLMPTSGGFVAIDVHSGEIVQRLEIPWTSDSRLQVNAAGDILFLKYASNGPVHLVRIRDGKFVNVLSSHRDNRPGAAAGLQYVCESYRVQLSPSGSKVAFIHGKWDKARPGILDLESVAQQLRDREAKPVQIEAEPVQVNGASEKQPLPSKSTTLSPSTAPPPATAAESDAASQANPVRWLPIGDDAVQDGDRFDAIYFSPDDRRILFAGYLNGGTVWRLWVAEKSKFIEYIDANPGASAPLPHPYRLATIDRRVWSMSRPRVLKVANDGLVVGGTTPGGPTALFDDEGKPRATIAQRFLNKAFSISPVEAVQAGRGQPYTLMAVDLERLRLTPILAGIKSPADGYYISQTGDAIAGIDGGAIQFALKTQRGANAWDPVKSQVKARDTASDANRFVNGGKWFLTLSSEGAVIVDPTTGDVLQKLPSSDVKQIAASASGDRILLVGYESVELLKIENDRLVSLVRDEKVGEPTALRPLIDAQCLQMSDSGRYVAFVEKRGGKKDSDRAARVGVLDLPAALAGHRNRADSKRALLQDYRKPLENAPRPFERYVGAEIPFELQSAKDPKELLYIHGAPELADAASLTIDPTNRWVKADVRGDVLLLDTVTGERTLLSEAHKFQDAPIPKGLEGGLSSFSLDGKYLATFRALDSREAAARLAIWEIGNRAPVLIYNNLELAQSIPQLPECLRKCREMTVLTSPTANARSMRLLFTGDDEAAVLELADGQLRLVAAGKTGGAVGSWSRDGRYLFAVDKDRAVRQFEITEQGELKGVRILSVPEKSTYSNSPRLSRPLEFVDLQVSSKGVSRFRFDGEALTLQGTFDAGGRIHELSEFTNSPTLGASINWRGEGKQFSRELVVAGPDLRERSSIPLDLYIRRFCVTSDGRFVVALGDQRIMIFRAFQ